MSGACFVYHPKGCDSCSTYVEHLLKDVEQCPSKFSFPRDEILDRIHEAWPQVGNYITETSDECDALEKELYQEKSDNHRLRDTMDDLQERIQELETQLMSLQATNTSSECSIMLTSPTNSPFMAGEFGLQEPCPEASGAPKSLVTPYMADTIGHTNPMSVPSAIRDNPDSYFLEEDADITAWLSKIIADIPCQAFMYQMKAVFGSRLNFEMIFRGFSSNSLTPHHQQTQWITNTSTPIRVGVRATLNDPRTSRELVEGKSKVYINDPK
ncbi:hypothetical protein M422DRAFT_247033 [Sphaerobolus stellatus SS14]|nr:hypothetical protein M422DRAFT_247033 [Sphaerobolus stellatus SS14]